MEALQLGDCGQELALISRLTEGSKIFLSREESQCFIKESVQLKSCLKNRFFLVNAYMCEGCNCGS